MNYLILILFCMFFNLSYGYNLIETLSFDLDSNSIKQNYKLLKNNNSNITVETSSPELIANDSFININNNSEISFDNINESNKTITILLSTFGGLLGYTLISLTIYKILKMKELKKSKKKEKEKIERIAKTIECIEIDEINV